jgi:hypothetical protein
MNSNLFAKQKQERWFITGSVAMKIPKKAGCIGPIEEMRQAFIKVIEQFKEHWLGLVVYDPRTKKDEDGDAKPRVWLVTGIRLQYDPKWLEKNRYRCVLQVHDLEYGGSAEFKARGVQINPVEICVEQLLTDKQESVREAVRYRANREMNVRNSV